MSGVAHGSDSHSSLVSVVSSRGSAGDAADNAQTDAATVLTRGTLVIDAEACKGCELCIDACPPRVLTMGTDVNTRGYRFPVLAPGCTGCRACSQICPDFVFQVYKYETPLELSTRREDVS
jgi:2-oxoglutarate ferredoxin oxidoreductase subunit delta